jgi:Rrf2 family protein
MSAISLQFSVAAHVMTALGYHEGERVSSAQLAEGIHANPSFVRKSLSKLAKAGLVETARGKHGASWLARPAAQITLLDIYRASEAPLTFALHDYPVEQSCPVSPHIKSCLGNVLERAQASFEAALANITLAELVRGIRQQNQ